jgi:hypothetical protein
MALPLAAIGGWFVNTRLGQSVVLAAAIVAAVAITYNVVEQKGYNRCKAEWDLAIANAGNEAANAENERDAESSGITQDARASNEDNIAAVDKTAEKSTEVVNDVYDAPPRTQPVAYGSCVHPVDPRVQDEIERGFRQANPAAR